MTSIPPLVHLVSDDEVKDQAKDIFVFRKGEGESEFKNVKRLDISALKYSDKTH